MDAEPIVSVFAGKKKKKEKAVVFDDEVSI